MPLDPLETICKILSTQTGIPAEDISPDDCMRRELGVDSLGMLELLQIVEGVFGVEFGDHELNRIATVNNLVTMVEFKQRNHEGRHLHKDMRA